ncbi:MAG: cobalt-precorrin-4/precorrin-4 C(11)-methyltransferase, partial [Spirochaetia bacterium]|nr:cobalt-precorrin-4/precorrin-4 C(11)-methyltransferase [Spirochaetia bacterium]
VVRLHTGDPSLYGAIGEQMQELDRLGIEYDITPGVSAFSGAAASLKAEYTLPDVSQTVIITRAAGRTGVPGSEDLRSLASHGATMVLYLSAGLLDKVASDLIAGGYDAATPAAIVYKASWADEKICRCTLGTLKQAAEAAGITKTALIVVGKFLEGSFSRSRLYDPGFSTEFREASE